MLLLLFFKSGYKREGESVVLTKKAFDVARHCRESVKGFLDGEDVDPEIDTKTDGSVVRLEIYYNADAAVAYAQLFDFSSYAYEAATEIVELRDGRARTLIGKL